MSTFRVDNLQKEDGSAVITDGVIPGSILRNSGVGLIKISTQTASNASSVDFTGLDTVGRAFNAGQDINSYKSVVNGIKFAPGSGNITVSYFKLYGLT